MSRKHFKIVVVPPDSKQAWSVRIPSAVLPALAGAVIVGALILVSGSVLLGSSADLRLAGSRLVHENLLLKERLAGLEGRIAELRAILERNAEFQRKAQVLADLDVPEDDARRLGIGGPVFPGRDPLGQYDLKTAALALELEVRLNELEKECKFQEEHFEEILQSLETQKDKWSHTPSVNPVPDGWISSGFGMRKDPFTEATTMHTGLDLSAPVGAKVYATADGRVIFAENMQEYGLTLEIDHGNGTVTRYAHNKKLEVKRGQDVKRGQLIALVGKSGRTTAPHMHYEVRLHGRPVNPARYILTYDMAASQAPEDAAAN